MRLLNQSIKHITIPMLVVITAWSVLFYFIILYEIKESTDEGLENYKRQVVYQAQNDSTILSQDSFEEGFYSIKQIEETEAQQYKDRYSDTLVYMQDANDRYLELEPARMISTAFELDGNYYELKIIHSMIENDDLLWHIIWSIILLFVLLFLTITVVNNYTLRQLWRPFYIFLARLKAYRLGDNSKLPKIKTNTKEFNDLQIAVNTLLIHSISVYEQQKQFIGNASHELQTPLAIALNKLELLIEKGDLSDNQAMGIGEVIKIIERLVRTNKSLLLLSKIENRQYTDNQDITINNIVKQVISELEEIAEYHNIFINVAEQTTNLIINMDASLAHIAISNLIRNALFHNLPDGVIEINICNKSISVCNSGKEEPLDKNKIFDRFHKSNNSKESSGLGLSIVDAICKLYGFNVKYEYHNNKHCFKLSFSQVIPDLSI